MTTRTLSTPSKRRGASQTSRLPLTVERSGWLQYAHPVVVAFCAALGGMFFWAYWPVLESLAYDWRTNDDYSVGALVPLAVAYVAWDRRRALSQCAVNPCLWGGAIMLSAIALHIFGLLFFFRSAQRYSMVLTVAGLLLLVGGRHLFRRVFWLLALLFLMVPLPGQVHTLIAGPLQNLATRSAFVALELLGVVVVREGNVLILEGTTPIAVAEACSGLRLLTAFMVVTCVMALIVRRPRWQKTALVLSSIPVAVVCNLIRLTATALVFTSYGNEAAERFFHDFAGLLMMPMALALLYAELRLFDLLVNTDEVLSIEVA
ncbi:MAG: exosortase/archaeosortase family protein [Phycisphaerae bacterium]